MKTDPNKPVPYLLDDQIGFVLRRATQRHLAIFSSRIGDLTPTQFAVLAKLCDTGPLSQNALGRLTAMDAATVKGVVDRLVKRGLVTTGRDKVDRRRTIVDLSPEGKAAYRDLAARAHDITAETLAPLSQAEASLLLQLLDRIT
ncbi:MAG: MarR family transcriptional regulator [Rhodobacteraceae bacterium]|nr:MarR family transcriptional regulator [Paracoccaceae bacterium]